MLSTLKSDPLDKVSFRGVSFFSEHKCKDNLDNFQKEILF